ncbi:MAG: outer membrane lipoprotein carrier protein LolA [Flavobacteriales bacterium]|nr:outer membrane lipoprotein carrier protein LolA [Flavobacteriales bacterium]
MNNKIITLSATAILTGLLSLAQAQDDGDVRDPKAKKILDEVSAQTSAYTDISAHFTYTLENKESDIHDSQDGEIIIKGSKYNLKIAGREIIFDGKHMWTIMPTDEEVTKSLPDKDAFSPADMFKTYEEGWKFRYIKKAKEGNVDVDLIDLVPKNGDKSFSRVRLSIDGAKKRVVKAYFFGKDGSSYIYELKDMKSNQNVPDSKFMFDPKAHPDYDVTDLTE